MYIEYITTQPVSANELLPLIITGGRFEATFEKKNGDCRTLDAVFESTRHIDKGIVTVFDFVKNGYRSLNLETLLSLSVNNSLFERTEEGTFIQTILDKELVIRKIERVIDMPMPYLSKWTPMEVYELHLGLENIYVPELDAIRAYEESESYIDNEIISMILCGELKFYESMTLEQLAASESFDIPIPIPEHIDISYGNYSYQASDLEPYFAETSYGVIQIKQV